MDIENSVYFPLTEIQTMAAFLAEIIRQGLAYKVERYDDNGFRIYLLGGF
jgi:hypothetical protein